MFITASAALIAYLWRTRQEKADMDTYEQSQESRDHALLKANQEASEIIRTATKKAREMLEGAEMIQRDSSSTLAEELTSLAKQHKQYLKDASLKYVETYEHMAERAQEEYLETLHEASQSMAGDAKHTLDMFETFLKDQTIGYKQQMEKKIEELRDKVNESVNEYKKDKLKRVDKAINEIIIVVAKNVIGRSLNIKEHNELVLRALEEAKKEGFFSHLEL
ncbi:MAG: Uncharacterized protein G01um101470_187 [Parcubacteria group bacterium Gr01-1014_70]|nr:MAG: Uncharacterized protein G01um101470_187 [Parcubacteria group bacterium Gr01-1014_70]